MHEKDANETLLRLSNVSRVFVTEEVETHALVGVDLTVRSGEYVSVEGPSGSGKSTLLAVLGLLDTPTEGRYALAGRDVHDLHVADRALLRNREIGFVFQSFNLIGDLDVSENVALPLVYAGVPRAERSQRVADALQRVGMSHRARHMPQQLSGGQQQRVAVARAVVGEPSLLLADEPTGNLDSHNGETVMALLDELHGAGSTIVMVTHDPRYGSCADRVVRLLDGRVEGDGPRQAADAATAGATA